MTSAVTETRTVCNIASISRISIMAKARTISAKTVAATSRSAGAGQSAAISTVPCVVALTVELALVVLPALTLSVTIFWARRALGAIITCETVVTNALASVEITLAIACTVVWANVLLATLPCVA